MNNYENNNYDNNNYSNNNYDYNNYETNTNKKPLSYYIKRFLLAFLFIVIVIFLLLWIFPTKSALNPFYDKIFGENINTMKEVAIAYYTTERLPKDAGDTKRLTLGQMLDMKLLLEIKDKNGDMCDVDDSYVELTKLDNEYKMKVNLKCGEQEDYIIVYLGCYDYCLNDICEKQDTTSSTNKNSTTNKNTTTTVVKKPEKHYCAIVNGKYYDNNGNVKIESVSANDSESERSAYILVMPTAVYEEMMKKVADAGFVYDNILFSSEGDGINTGDDTHVNYDKYTVLAFKQEKAESTEGEFIVSNALSTQPIECLPGDGGTGLSNHLFNEYSLDKSKIYSIAVGKNSSISIDPMLSMSEWMSDGDINKAVIAKDFSGDEVDITQWGLGLNAAETAFVFSSIPVNDSFFIIFKGTDNLNKKALIIQVNE